MHFYPAGGAGHILSVIFGSPTLYKTHANSAHLCELIDSLKAVVDRLSEQLSKLLIVEDLEAAAAGDLADGSGMEAMVVVAIPALHENAGVTQTLGVHLSSNIIQVNTFANMAAGILDCGVAVDIGQKAQAKAIFVVGRISEAVHQHASRGGMVSLTNTVIQLIVHNRAPVAWFLILYRLHISSWHHAAASIHGIRAILSH